MQTSVYRETALLFYFGQVIPVNNWPPKSHIRSIMTRMVIILGVVLAIAISVILIFTMLYKAAKCRGALKNNEYDNYPQD